MSQVALECANYLQVRDSGWHKSEILTHNAASVFRVFLKTLPPVTKFSSDVVHAQFALSAIGNVFLYLCILTSSGT